MPLDRRHFAALGATALGGLTLLAGREATAAGPRVAAGTGDKSGTAIPASELGIETGTERDQTARLQAAIDKSSRGGATIVLPPGRFRIGELRLRVGTQIIGSGAATRLEFTGGQSMLTGHGASGCRIEGLVLDGRGLVRAGPGLGGLIDFIDAPDLTLRGLGLLQSPFAGITMARSGGRITDCTFSELGTAAIHALDSDRLVIAHNMIARIKNNGILVWRSKPGDDGTIVSGNHVRDIAAAGGGTGQNGNGINVYKAGGVLVTGNRITDCAYTAVRANSASDVQIIANSCQRLGEVALYAEFAFEGAVIASNLVDSAATGVSVTNFDKGGRLAVVQGNIVRNLVRREAEPEDKRGEGIAVEADAVVTGNVIENAATVGMLIGWGRYMRDVIASQNLIRRSPIGIAISGDKAAGSAMITGNLIQGATLGAIRTMNAWTPFGPDLATAKAQTGRIQATGNMVA